MLSQSNPPRVGREQDRACKQTYSFLRSQFKGDLLRPRDPSYEEARAIWNGMVAQKPGLIVSCLDVGDVQTAIRIATDTGVLSAVRCGGHSLAGFSTCDGGLVIDLSKMREISVNPNARWARVAGGCLLGLIDTATQKAGLVFPSGVVSHSGASGLILGGGTGWLTRRFGLSCDNVKAFTLVMVDDSIVRADAKENADLFGAQRGGGGNFGAVTEFELKLHPLKSVVLAEGLTPESHIRQLLECGRDFMADAPFDLKWNLDLRLARQKQEVPAQLRGRPVAASSLVWTGTPEAAQPYFERAFSLCHPDSVRGQIVSFLRLQTMARLRLSAQPPLLQQSWATFSISMMSRLIAFWMR
jgi:FAD binding domain